MLKKIHYIQDLKIALLRCDNYITKKKYYFCFFHTNEAHDTNLTGPITAVVQKLRSLISDKIKKLVRISVVVQIFKDNNPEKLVKHTDPLVRKIEIICTKHDL